MNSQFYLEKLYNSEIFKKFQKENPDAYLCSGFFVIDKTGKEGNKQHFDYYLPNVKKMVSFQVEDKIKEVPVEIIEGKIFEKINDHINLDFENIEKIIIDEMNKQNIKNKIEKILLSLQNIDGNDFILGTIFISALGMIKIHINILEKKVISFEKKSIFDMLKIVKKKSH